MTAQSTISLYTQDYYTDNKTEIDASSRCGNVVELVTIDNYTYVSVKATEFPFDEEGNEIDFREYSEVEATMWQDLTDLRNGVFSCYRMIVEQFLPFKEMQRTEGDSTDHVRFERYIDPWPGGGTTTPNWKVTLTKENVNAFSLVVWNNEGTSNYPIGSFIDAGDGTWYCTGSLGHLWDDGDVNFEFILGSEAVTQLYHIDKDIQEAEWNISYFADGGGDSPEVTEWVQPTGAHDAYNIGDTVLFEGVQYESLIDANTWSPTVYPAGWQQV